MKIALAAVVLLFASPLAAQTEGEPFKPHLHRIDWVLLASDAGARALDTYSTRWSLRNQNREMFLPGFIANHTAPLAAFEGGMVTLNYFAARRLIRHGHPKWARILMAADSIQVYPWAIRNLTMPKCRH